MLVFRLDIHMRKIINSAEWGEITVLKYKA
jgi:hypothetical protein